MSRANKAKRLWKQIKQREMTAPDGCEGVLYEMPREWLDMDTGLPPEMADMLVRDLRAAGADIWLYPHPDGSIRTRIALAGPQPDAETLRVLARYARDIGKAVERSGKWDAPPNNPFGDPPLPPGGHWTWL